LQEHFRATLGVQAIIEDDVMVIFFLRVKKNMIDDVCAYIQHLLMQPSTQDIIERLRDSQVCTMHQCFESVDDMIPMTMPVPQNSAFLPMMFVAAALLSMVLRLNKLRNLNAIKMSGPPPPPPPPLRHPPFEPTDICKKRPVLDWLHFV